MKSVMYKNRRDNLMKALGEGVLVLSGASSKLRNGDVDYEFRQNSDFYYLSGFNEPDAALVISNLDGEVKTTLFVPERDKEKEIWFGKRLGTEGVKREFGVAAYSSEELSERLAGLLGGHKTLFYEFFDFPVMDEIILDTLKQFKTQLSKRQNPVTPQSVEFYRPVLSWQRQFKSTEELEDLKVAVEITREAFEASRKLLPELKSENQVLATLQYHYRANGGISAFGDIVASGANATCLHYTENNDSLIDKDSVLLDSGCEYNLMCADVSRCYPVNGKFSEKTRAIYSIVLAANEAAIEQCVSGNTLRQVHRAACEVLAKGLLELGVVKGDLDEIIENGALRKFYMHNTSHWLGMDVHDTGLYEHDGSAVKLQPGMIFTVEPGLYFNPDFSGEKTEYDGIGIRIEDDILITEDGAFVLTNSIPKKLQDIESA